MTETHQFVADKADAASTPRAHLAHADPDSQVACGDLCPPASVAQKPLAQKSAARWAYERVILYIRNFEQQLDNAHEVAMGFTGADAGVLRIEGVGYYDPDIVTFYGSDPAGTKTQLIQHVSQLNVLLRAMPKPTAEDAPRRIGFRLVEDLETEPSEE